MRLLEALRGIKPGNVDKVLVGDEKLGREDAQLMVEELHQAHERGRSHRHQRYAGEVDTAAFPYSRQDASCGRQQGVTCVPKIEFVFFYPLIGNH